MGKLNAKKLGLALGTTGAIIYLGCICLMLIAGQDGTTWFFNSILHGLDVSSVSRMDVPIGQSIIGIILTFGYRMGKRFSHWHHIQLGAKRDYQVVQINRLI